MIKDLIGTEGPVFAIFMVKASTRAVSNNGTPYLSLTLQDMSGSVDAKMWQIEDSDVELASAGNLVKVNGTIGTYKGHPQVKINELEAVAESEVDMAKFIPAAPTSLVDMKAELRKDVDLIDDPELKTLTESLLKENFEAFTTYPAAVTVHHAYLGGLLYHSLSVCALALQIQAHYPFLSKDYLIAGCLLHDIGKTKELSGPKISSYTTEGNLLGHITLGTMMVYEKGKSLGIGQEKLDVLAHMILSHHGEPDFGSAKTPATAEALVLHIVDDLDAKMDCLKNAYALTEEGEFTMKVPWIDGTSFYKIHPLGKNRD
jgi:3'-5' exoribonuclease